MKTLLVGLTLVLSLSGWGGARLWAMGNQEGLLTTTNGDLPSQAQLETVSPSQVLPGCLVRLTGNHFGTQARPFQVGSIPIRQVLAWSDTVILFRLPPTDLPEGPLALSLPAPTPLTVVKAPAGSQIVRWVLDLPASQKRLAADPRSLPGQPPLLLLPLFELYDQATGQHVAFRAETATTWAAEYVAIPTAETVATTPNLIALVPFPEAGPEARRAIEVLQDLWAQADPFPLIRSAPAWFWGARDPRFQSVRQPLRLSFP